MEKNQLQMLRGQLVDAVKGGQAHLDVATVFDGVKHQAWGAKLAGSPHTLWQLMEHIRFTLDDLLVFSTDKQYKAPDWPKDYWPTLDEPASADAANKSLAALKTAVQAMVSLIESADSDLFAKISWGDGQTILREALLAATHTSYHLGQAMLLRKQLEA
jgi:hypothetical protein